MGNMSGDYGSHYTLKQTITVNSQNKTNNTSNITIRLYLSFDGSSYYAYTYDSSSGEMKVNRWDDDTLTSLGTFTINELVFASGQAKDILLAEWTDNVSHNADGTKTINTSGIWNTNTSRIGSGSCSAMLVLPAIERTAIITSLPNFEHGSNASVTIDNPSGSVLTLVMKIGSTQILSQSASTGANTIAFTDAQLDAIYKLYGSNSSLTVTFSVTTSAGFTSSKTCTIILKGNQKTGRTNVSGTWKRGKLWTNVNGAWRRAVLWTNVNGTWKRGI